MPNLPSNPAFQQHPSGQSTETQNWAASFLYALGRVLYNVIYTVNALCKVDTIANRSSAPQINEIFFVASDTYQQYVGIAGVWSAVGRTGGTVMGAVDFTEIADAAAPAANGARLYARDNGAGKTQLVVRFNTGAVQVIATEP